MTEYVELDYIPEHGEKLATGGILIEWDFPKPVNPVVWKPNGDSWFKRLAPLKHTPGRAARVKRDLKNIDTARSATNVIRKSVWQHDPRAKWIISYAKADDGTYGVWVTYVGVRSDKEQDEYVALRAQRSRLSKLRRLNNQQKKALRRSLMNPTLKPPVVGPSD